MEIQNVENENPFSIEFFYTYIKLRKPIALLKSNLLRINGDFVYAKKVDGIRGMYVQTRAKAYIEYEDGDKDYQEPVGSDSFVLDIEITKHGFIVLDVLYFNEPMISQNLMERLSFVPKNFKVQVYTPVSQFEPAKCEGFILFNALLPYDFIEVFKFKYEYTIDFLRVSCTQVQSSDGKLFTACNSLNVGKIEELNWDLSRVIRVRGDKLYPNNSYMYNIYYELASESDLLSLRGRKGKQVISFQGEKIVKQAETWLTSNVTLSQRITPIEEESEEEVPLFDFDIMKEDGTFTPEYLAYREKYYAEKKTVEEYVKAVGVEAKKEVEQEDEDDIVRDVAMLIDLKVITPMQDIKKVVYVSEMSIPDNIAKTPDIQHIVSSVSEETIEKWFTDLSSHLGGEFVVCEVHNQRCVRVLNGEMECVRDRILSYVNKKTRPKEEKKMGGRKEKVINSKNVVNKRKKKGKR